MRLRAAYYGERRISEAWLGTRRVDIGRIWIRIFGEASSQMALGGAVRGGLQFLVFASSASGSPARAGASPVSEQTVPEQIASAAELHDGLSALHFAVIPDAILESLGDGVASASSPRIRSGTVMAFTLDGFALAAPHTLRSGVAQGKVLNEFTAGTDSGTQLSSGVGNAGTDSAIPNQSAGAPGSSTDPLIFGAASGHDSDVAPSVSTDRLFEDLARADSSGGRSAGGTERLAGDYAYAGSSRESFSSATERGPADCAYGARAGLVPDTLGGKPADSVASADASGLREGVSPRRLLDGAAFGTTLIRRGTDASASLSDDSAFPGKMDLQNGGSFGVLGRQNTDADALPLTDSGSAERGLDHFAAAIPLPNVGDRSSEQGVTAEASGNLLGLDYAAAQNVLGADRANAMRRSPLNGGASDAEAGGVLSPKTAEPTPGGGTDVVPDAMAAALSEPETLGTSCAIGAQMHDVMNSQRVRRKHMKGAVIRQSCGGSALRTARNHVLSTETQERNGEAIASAGLLRMDAGVITSDCGGSTASGEAQSVWAVLRDGWLVIRQAYGASDIEGFLTIE